MPVIVNKVGGHRNEDALGRVIYYMMSSAFFRLGDCRGVWTYSAPDIIGGFNFIKEIFNKTDGKIVDHVVIGIEQHEGIVEGDLIEIAEAALDYFYSGGYQCCFAIHKGSRETPNYLHAHIAVNTVNFMTGCRLYETFAATSELKHYLMGRFDSYKWFSVNDNSPYWET